MCYAPFNLTYCRIQYNTANNNKNNYSAPASRLWSGTGHFSSMLLSSSSSSSPPLLFLFLFLFLFLLFLFLFLLFSPYSLSTSYASSFLISFSTYSSSSSSVVMLSNVVDITLRTVSITCCKLQQQLR